MTSPVFSLGFAPLLQAAGGGSMFPIVFQFVAIVAIIYFIMWRPQQQQRKKHETSLASLKRGDQIVTAGGIVGEVVHIRETSKDGGANRMNDLVTIRSGESKLVVERARIARIDNATSSSASTTDAATK